MKSQLIVRVLACVGIGAFCVPAVAQEEEGSTPQRRDREERRAPVERSRDPLGEEIRFTERLRDAVMDKLDLDEDQRAAIVELFAGHIDAVKRVAAERPDRGEREEQREQIRELEREARAAREVGDREEARRIYREIRELRQEVRERDLADLGPLNRELIQAVSEELEEEQLLKFRRLVQRFRARTARGTPLLRFMHTVRRALAELQLDEEQQATVHEIVRDTMMEVDRPKDNPQAIDDFMDHVRPKLESELGSELTQELMAALEKERRRMKSSDKEARRPPRKRGPQTGEPEKTGGEEAEPEQDQAEPQEDQAEPQEEQAKPEGDETD